MSFFRHCEPQSGVTIFHKTTSKSNCVFAVAFLYLGYISKIVIIKILNRVGDNLGGAVDEEADI